MSDGHDNHGQTPAAWTAVVIMILAFAVGGIGLIAGQLWIFWVGVAMFFVGIVVGKVMQMAGLGAKPKEHAPAKVATDG
jgi:hypothetical protein